MAGASYEYRPLSVGKHEIRLLELLPGETTDPVCAEPLHVSLDKPLRYETISYVWGDPTRTEPIFLSDRELLVPKNTVAALRRMRTLDAPRLLWIDAVCINQDDVQERGKQVGIMGLIYGSSTGNLIHLPADDAMAARIIKAVETLDREAHEATDGFRVFSARVRNPLTGDFSSRLWVLQEARLAPQNICFLGSLTMSLEVILRAARWVDHTTQLLIAKGAAAAGRRCMVEMYDMVDTQEGHYRSRGGYASLMQLLIIAQNFENTEPRDGIYAILGLIKKRPAPHEVIPAWFKPDYSRSLGDVLRDATRIVAVKHSLDILRFVNHRDDTELGLAMPSWVRRADWTYSAELDARPLQHHFIADRGLRAPSLLVLEPEDPAVLSLEGFVVDRVLVATDHCPTATFARQTCLDSWLADAVTKLLCIATEKLPAHVPPPSLLTVATAACAQRAHSGGLADTEAMDAAADHLGVVLGSRNIDGAVNHLQETSNGAGTQPFNMNDLRNRRLFVTLAGRAGLGPKVTLDGDVIVVARGSSLPLLLRPCNPSYHFVGSAYLYGVMQSEAVDAFKATARQEEIFHVR
ncbi:hypothetical protein LTR86_011176 [Recurvomyces mirabilis]|nr:hypothetical protein LTR86_011176 [Recurvomyces mirabilis]